MLEFAQFGALAVALVSFLLSLTSLLVHYAKRAENPITAPLEQQIQALQLGQVDLVDRIEHWTRRDRTRRLRAAEAEPESVEPTSPAEVKRQLRLQARQIGIGR